MVTMPVPKGFYVTSGFGPRWGQFHYGTDFGRDGGSGKRPVYAVKDGTVTRSGPASGFGRWVTIDHPASNGGGETVYGHVVPEVTVGQKVKEGQRIAHIDPSSATNGGVAPHLHLEWHRYVWSPPGPDRLDPMVMLRGAKWVGETAPSTGSTKQTQPPQVRAKNGQPATNFIQLTTVDRGWRDPKTVPLIAIHTYECPRETGEKALRARAKWQQDSQTGSYTVLVSADGLSLRANDDNYTPCASLYTGDRNGFHLSFLGYAADSRETWLKHDKQLREAARICADWCRLYGHEPRRLTVEEVQGRKKKGFCSHGDISAAYRESDHTDPGKNFPWDVFLTYVRGYLHPPQKKAGFLMALTDAQQEDLKKKVDVIHRELTTRFPSRYKDGDGTPSTFADTLVGYILELDRKVEDMHKNNLPAIWKTLTGRK